MTDKITDDHTFLDASSQLRALFRSCQQEPSCCEQIGPVAKGWLGIVANPNSYIRDDRDFIFTAHLYSLQGILCGVELVHQIFVPQEAIPFCTERRDDGHMYVSFDGFAEGGIMPLYFPPSRVQLQRGHHRLEVAVERLYICPDCAGRLIQ